MKNPHAWLLGDLKKVEPNGLRVLTTFSCGGGSSMGYKLAGFDVVLANDIDPKMAWHYKTNLNPKHYVLAPINELAAQLPSNLGEIDVLDGSPPCSTFSLSGSREDSWGKNKIFREGQTKQVLSDLFFDFLDLVEVVRPRAVIAENVKGMMSGNAKGYCSLVFARLRELGYSPQMFLIDASKCGVPQKRERVFIVAPRTDVSTQRLVVKTDGQPISAGEATADLVLSEEEKLALALNGKIDVDWWDKTSPGKSYATAFKRLKGKSSFFNHVRLSGIKPACTLVAADRFTHWSERRRLSFAEWKRLGGFPDDYVASGDNIGRYVIGMSVPPKMMQVVASAVASQWLGAKPISQVA